MNPPPDYKPIPVEAAQKISDAYDKDVVIIVAFDHRHSLVHHSTFGVSAEDKVAAANMGETIADLIGDTPKSVFFEDFRDLDAAKAKVQIDDISKKLQIASKVLGEHWLALRALTEALDIDGETAFSVKAQGQEVCSLTLQQIMDGGAQFFGRGESAPAADVEATFQTR